MHISSEVHDQLPKSKLKPNDVLLSMAGTIGISTLFDKEFEANSNQAIAKIRLSDTKIDARFLSIFLNSKLGFLQSLRISNGGVQANINLGEIGTIIVPKPPLEIQRSLVAEIEAAQQARKQKLAQADELLFNLNKCFVEILGLTYSLQSDSTGVRAFAIKRTKVEPRLDCQFYFVEHYTLAENLKKAGFPIFKIGSSKISQSIVDGPFGSQLKVEEYQESGIPLIRVSNCRSGKIFEDGELVYISEEKHQQLIRSEVLPGDVLLTKAGYILGYAAVFPEDLVKGNITSHLASIRPSESIVPEFLAAYLRSYWGNAQIYRWGNKATRPELNTDEVRQILVPLPPLKVQRSLVAEIEKRRADAQRLRQEAETDWEAAKTRFERQLLGEADP